MYSTIHYKGNLQFPTRIDPRSVKDRSSKTPLLDDTLRGKSGAVGSSLDSISARKARLDRCVCNPFKADQVRGVHAGEDDNINPPAPSSDPATRSIH